jgi:cyclohexanone monooxygenase
MPDSDYDVLVIGAGFSGLYALHRLRELGLTTTVLEKAGEVGGTWLFNRYPGARCDIESIEYSYSFSPEIEQEWIWTENMPAQPEVEAYLNFVADKLDMRRDIQFNTCVTAMEWSEGDARWTVRTDTGRSFTPQFVIAASGILSVPLEPDIDGIKDFGGQSLFTSNWPKDDVDLTGKRVAVIGTGSTAVQLLPVIADQVGHLTLFQRSAAYTLPWQIRELEPGELDELKAQYPEIRAAQREHLAGAARLNAFSYMLDSLSRPPIKESTAEERRRAVEEGGVLGAVNWGDVFFDIEANDMARDLYGDAVAQIVKDPETAAALKPSHPLGCKRPIIDQGYYEVFNRDNVTLVDLRKGGIRRVVPGGIETEQGEYEFDVIIYATGFDAMTGALTKMDIRGRNGTSLAEYWNDAGPLTYLGVAVAGFPNLFLVVGPGSPAPLSNYLALLEPHLEWITDCVMYLREHGHRSIDVQPDAQAEWMQLCADYSQATMFVRPNCNSWYNGANVPGKPRLFMAFVAGMPEFRRLCAESSANAYRGFELA